MVVTIKPVLKERADNYTTLSAADSLYLSLNISIMSMEIHTCNSVHS